MKTEQQIRNLEEALIWWQTVPEDNVSSGLGLFNDDFNPVADCRTVACFGGWACHWPELQRQGLTVGPSGEPRIENCNVWGTESALPIFGDRTLFKERGHHAADAGFKGTDHELVTNRIRWALEHA